MSGQAPPAIPRTATARNVSLRILVADAAFHARNMARSLGAAASIAQTRRGERKLSHLAKMARHWATRLDPNTYKERQRRAKKRAAAQP